MTVREWYDKTIAFVRSEVDRYQQDTIFYTRVRDTMPYGISRTTMQELVNIFLENVKIMSDLINLLQDMYDAEEEMAEDEAWLENYPVPDDYDPHPCVEQLREDSIIVQSYPCYGWTCGKCGGTHYEIVHPAYYHG
jgi:hypothetical protein